MRDTSADAKRERPGLTEALSHLRLGDPLVVRGGTRNTLLHEDALRRARLAATCNVCVTGACYPGRVEQVAQRGTQAAARAAMR